MKKNLLNKKWILIIILLLIFSFNSCRTSPSDLYSIREPIRFKACSHGDTDTNQKRSYASLLNALDKYRWTIEYTSPNYDRLEVSYCTMSRGPTDCATLHFKIDNFGNVTGFAPQDKPVLNKLKSHVHRWVRNIETYYQRNKCMDMQSVQDILNDFGLQ